jgi:dTDP-4-amino-4,6-dideoxygalactose transaminase
MPFHREIDVTRSVVEQQLTNIPLVDLKRQHAPLRVQIEAAFAEVMKGMQLFLGPNVRAFEETFRDYAGTRECVGVSDGTTALHLSLLACGIGPGDEVITVSNTFFATVEAIALAGARPVFVDVEPNSFLIDMQAVEQAITPRTRAIIPVHLYGCMADITALMALARRYGLRVIEDACQAHGARRNGHMAGTVGDVGCFSFYFSKNLGAYGEAGGVVTNDRDIARRIRLLRDHGSERRYHHDAMGMNGRLDELQAAVLRIKLPYLDNWNEARRSHAARYSRLLEGLPITLPLMPGANHVFHLYVIRTDERDALRQHLDQLGVHTGIHYPVPCHLQPACATFGPGTGSLPITESLASEILSLPMFPELRDDEIDYIAEAINSFYVADSSAKFAGVA